jgi:hypothetical protein
MVGGFYIEDCIEKTEKQRAEELGIIDKKNCTINTYLKEEKLTNTNT